MPGDAASQARHTAFKSGRSHPASPRAQGAGDPCALRVRWERCLPPVSHQAFNAIKRSKAVTSANVMAMLQNMVAPLATVAPLLVPDERAVISWGLPTCIVKDSPQSDIASTIPTCALRVKCDVLRVFERNEVPCVRLADSRDALALTAFNTVIGDAFDEGNTYFSDFISHSGRVLLITFKGEIVGFIQWEYLALTRKACTPSRVAHIVTLQTSEASPWGWGAALLAMVCEWARSEGCDAAVMMSTKVAAGYYQRLGATLLKGRGASRLPRYMVDLRERAAGEGA